MFPVGRKNESTGSAERCDIYNISSWRRILMTFRFKRLSLKERNRFMHYLIMVA